MTIIFRVAGILFLTTFLPNVRSFTVPQPVGLTQQKIIQLARRRYQIDNEDDNTPMDGKIVVVTGAAGGIGCALCRTMHNLGATVIALDRNEKGLIDLQTLLENNKSNDDRRVLTFTTHHEDLSSVAGVADKIKASFPKIDVLINNAGLAYPQHMIPGSPAMISAHDKDLAFTVNHLSHVLLTEKLLDNLSNANGRIVHMTSSFHWKVDGSELMPHLNDDGSSDDPIAFRSKPEEQSPKHVARSYANTKLAQIWYSRSVSSSQAVPNCKSVCACPTWAATGIAGEDARDFLGNFAFPITNCGPGLTSALNAILRSDDDLGDALDNGRSFVANSRTVEYMWGLEFLITKLSGPLRDVLADILAVILLIGQRYTYEEFIIQETSPESFNDEGRRKTFYEWSLKEVQPWLQ